MVLEEEHRALCDDVDVYRKFLLGINPDEHFDSLGEVEPVRCQEMFLKRVAHFALCEHVLESFGRWWIARHVVVDTQA